MKMFLKGILIMLAALSSSNSYSQKQGQAKIDSLLQELPKTKEDTNKVKLLNDLSYTYSNINTNEGVKYAQMGLVLAEKLGWKKGIPLANNALGNNYITKSDFSKALNYFLIALKSDEELGDKYNIANDQGSISIVYSSQGNFPKSLEYLFKALKCFEELGDKDGIANCLGNIGILYQFLSDYPRALEYTFKALKINEEINDKSGIAANSGNIGLTYDYLGNYPKALEYEFKALKKNEELGDKYGIESNLGNIGRTYTNQGNYPGALAYSFKSLKIAEDLQDKSRMAANLGNIGSCYLNIAKDTTGKMIADTLIPKGKTANLLKAIDYFNRDIKISKETGDLNTLQDCLNYLSDALERLGNYKEALESHKQYMIYKDSVFNADNKIKIANEGTKRAEELNQKQVEINKIIQAKKHNEQIFFISGIMVLVIIIFIIFRNNKLLSFEKKKSEDLLLNILPAEVADELKTKGVADAKLYDPVTVLFTDFVGFTTAGQRMAPQQLVGELHACFKRFDEIISKYNIEKIKTVGDAYLAVSGLPAANPNHATDIVAAAIEISDFMLKRRERLGEATFGIRLGIHSGSVVAGIVGVKKFAYDIWGDTVNTAARMEQNSEAGKINISATTYELVKDKFTCEYRGEIDAKGKGMLKMYYVS